MWTSVLAVLVSALLPPTHIHLAEHDHDHQHDAVEHAHWSPHRAPSRLALDDDDGRTIFVDHQGVVGSAEAPISRPAAELLVVIPVVAAFNDARTAQRHAGNAPRDGPTRDLSTLRGPPRFAR